MTFGQKLITRLIFNEFSYQAHRLIALKLLYSSSFESNSTGRIAWPQMNFKKEQWVTLSTNLVAFRKKLITPFILNEFSYQAHRLIALKLLYLSSFESYSTRRIVWPQMNFKKELWVTLSTNLVAFREKLITPLILNEFSNQAHHWIALKLLYLSSFEFNSTGRNIEPQTNFKKEQWVSASYGRARNPLIRYLMYLNYTASRGQ